MMSDVSAARGLGNTIDSMVSLGRTLPPTKPRAWYIKKFSLAQLSNLAFFKAEYIQFKSFPQMSLPNWWFYLPQAHGMERQALQPFPQAFLFD